MTTTRQNASEGATVRLYFRNYVSNVLTDVTSPNVKIYPRNTTNLVSPTIPNIVKESEGVYYFDWSIPSSDPTSNFYKSGFAGAGDYQDIWYDGATPLLAQDFYVYPEGYPNNLGKVVEPLQFDYTLETNKLEYGAKDFVVWSIAERNSKLTPDESLFPDGEIQFYLNNEVVFNYSPMLHNFESNVYRYYLDTTQLREAVYKVQTRYTIPAGVREESAILTTEKSLSDGYSPSKDSNLLLTVDGIGRTISFPATSTSAEISATSSTSLSFFPTANDKFIASIDGTVKELNLLNTPTDKVLATLVDEFNGIVPTEYAGLSYPILTSGLTLSAIPSELNGTDLVFVVDGVSYRVQFNSPTTITDIITQINTIYTAGTIAQEYSGILVLSSDVAVSEIAITGGSAVSLLGLAVSQSDTNDHSVLPAVASIDGSAVKLSSNSELIIYSASQGSTANTAIGFSGTGESATGQTDLPASITGIGSTYPIFVVEQTSASVSSTADISTEFAYPNTLGGKTLSLDIDGGSFNVNFTDSQTPPAITSLESFGTFEFDASNNVLNITYDGTTVVTTFTIPAVSLGIANVVKEINDQITLSAVAGKIVADTFNGHLRIRSTETAPTGETLKIDTANVNTAYNILGFNGIPSSPENYYQNDQVIDSGPTIDASDYVSATTQSDIVAQISAYIGASGTVAISNNRVIITSLTDGSTSSVEITGGTAQADLNLPSGIVNGLNGTNSSFEVDISAVAQTITLSANTAKSLTDIVTEINAQASGFIATDVLGQLVLTTSSVGSSVILTLNNIVPQTTVATLFGAAIPVDGSDATSAEITGGAYSSTKFGVLANSIITIAVDGGASSIIDLQTATTLSDVATLIDGSITGTAVAAGNTLTIVSPTSGGNSSIEILGITSGSNANSTLNLAVDGLLATGSNGQPYTIDDIINRINSAYGGAEVAQAISNFISFNSINVGGGSSIIIEQGTSTELLTAFGISTGTTIGTTESQTAQIVVSPKFNLIIGDQTR